jgi:hypothetical protein
MNFCLRIVTPLVVLLSPCWANADRVRQVLVSALNNEVPTIDRQGQQELMDAARDLKPDELRSVLPLGMACLRSSHESARSAGEALFRGAEENSSAAVLLWPYVSDFADCLKTPSCFYRGWVVSWLVPIIYSPKPSAVAEAAAAALISNLEDEPYPDNINDPTAAKVVLENFPSDLLMRRRVLNFVEKRSDSLLTSDVVGALRNVDHFAPEDLAFIRSCLAEDNDPWVLAATIDLLAKIDPNVREQFIERLKVLQTEPHGNDVRAALERFFEHISQLHDSDPSKP